MLCRVVSRGVESVRAERVPANGVRYELVGEGKRRRVDDAISPGCRARLVYQLLRGVPEAEPTAPLAASGRAQAVYDCAVRHAPVRALRVAGPDEHYLDVSISGEMRAQRS